MGFEAAQKYATDKARDHKTLWKSITGETYGPQKAATWRAPLPPFSEADAVELSKLPASIADAELRMGKAQQLLGVAEYEAQKAKDRVATIEHLRATAKKHAEISGLVKTAEKELDELRRSLNFCQQKAGTKPPDAKTQLPCPECGALLMDSEDGESLVVWQAPEAAAHDPEAAARIPALEKAIAVQEKVLRRHQDSLAAADQAGHQLKALEDQGAQGPNGPDDPEPLRETLKALRSELETKRNRLTELTKAQSDLEAAGERTKQARAHHADVLAWSAIADALAPDGIPGELLAEALKPINDRLAQSAVESGWKQVRIGADMAITCDGRAYRLESASAQFRCDVQIAEAVSFLSGLKFLCIDSADILDLPGRGELLAWLDVLAAEDEIESALVLATLKERPAEWPETLRSIWIERGQVAEKKEREAA